MSLKAYVREAALATPALTALLGTSPFRWFSSTLLKGNVFPAVVARIVSDSATYTMTGMNAVGNSRIQLTLWANTEDSLEALETAVVCFLKDFNAMGVSNLVANPNYILNRIDRIYQEQNPILYQRILDVKIYSNQLVTA